MKKNIFMLLLSAIFVFAVMGCENEGSGEKAGKEIDKAIDKAEKEVNSAIEAVKEKIEKSKE